MNTFIKIETDQGGIDLFSSTGKSIDHHSAHLDQLMVWLTVIDKLELMPQGSGKALPFNDYRFVLQYNAMLNISTLELAVLARQLYISKHRWEKLYFSKQAYAIIYETIEKFNQYNKTMHSLLSQRSSITLNEFKTIASLIKEYKVKYDYEGTIREVRNRVASHIEDFKLYYPIINSIDTDNSLGAILEFVLILNSLQGITTGLSKAFQDEFTK